MGDGIIFCVLFDVLDQFAHFSRNVVFPVREGGYIRNCSVIASRIVMLGNGDIYMHHAVILEYHFINKSDIVISTFFSPSVLIISQCSCLFLPFRTQIRPEVL